MSVMTFGKIGTKPLFKHWTARDYVQNGLIAMWDGIENAGWGTHDPNATVWKDLVSGSLSTLEQGVSWTSNSAKTSEIGTRWAAVSGNTANDVLSLTAVFKTYDSTTLQFIYLNTYRRNCLGITTNSLGIGLRQSIPITTPSGKVWSLTVNYSTTSSQTADAAYVDGSINTNRGSSNFANPQSYGSNIGGGYNNGWFSGEIYNIRAYSSALTAEEIAYNYIVDKIRFNLP